jgi:energy-coupling factor transport system ATP-binding protein
VKNIIEIKNLHFRPDPYPHERPDILDGINLKVEAGSFVAIIGENGSGKTTLLKHINGLLLPTQGNVFVNDLNTKQLDKRRELRSIVEMVFQNPADQIVASTVEEDIAFSLENENIPTVDIQQRVSEQLALMKLTEYANKPPHLLSGGEVQKLALAGILIRKPKVILFDEPTSMLDPVSRKVLLEQIHDLNKQGMTIIYITHHMEEAVGADQVVVLQHGQLVSNGKPGEIFKDEGTLLEAGLELPEALSLAKNLNRLGWQIPEDILTVDELISKLPSYSGMSQMINGFSDKSELNPIIHVNNIYHTYFPNTPFEKQALSGISVKVNAGNIHGLAGGNGSGKSTFLQHLNSILQPDRGEIYVDGLELHRPETKLIDVIKKVGLVFQSPESQFFESFVGDEIAYGPKQFKFDDVRVKVKDAMAMVGLDFEGYKDRRLETLSGGEKRKVALASTLVLQQDILLFDEPSAGMDPQSRRELLILFEKLQRQGKTIVISTHRLEELARISSDITIMKNGQVYQTGDTGSVLLQLENISQVGLIPPPAVRVGKALKQRGWPIDPKKTITEELLLSSLRELTG